jgi:hypothetical protein
MFLFVLSWLLSVSLCLSMFLSVSTFLCLPLSHFPFTVSSISQPPEVSDKRYSWHSRTCAMSVPSSPSPLQVTRWKNLMSCSSSHLAWGISPGDGPNRGSVALPRPTRLSISYALTFPSHGLCAPF